MSYLAGHVGISPNKLADHEIDSMIWGWYDNHVALWFNLLRLYVMADVKDHGGLNTAGSFPKYDDGRIEIDPNIILPKADKPISWSWPGGDDPTNYPQWISIRLMIPRVNAHCIDLRALLRTEAIVVLMATGKWKRQSNFRIDFDYPKLADRLAYRFDGNIPEMNDWNLGEHHVNLPLIDKGVIWLALTKYVIHNHLYYHFYSAACVLSQLLLTVVPDSAEGQVWLMEKVEVCLPRFGSVRGKYTFFKNSDSGFADSTPLEEWHYIQSNVESLYITAVVVATCVSLASGLDVPLNGTSNAYVYYSNVAAKPKVWKIPCKYNDMSGYFRKRNTLTVSGLPYIGTPYACYPLNLT